MDPKETSPASDAGAAVSDHTPVPSVIPTAPPAPQLVASTTAAPPIEIKIIQHGGKFVLFAAPGLTVNATPVDAVATLAPGDVIALGDFKLVVGSSRSRADQMVITDASPTAPPARKTDFQSGSHSTKPRPDPGKHRALSESGARKLLDVASAVRAAGVETLGFKFPVLVSGAEKPLGEDDASLVYPLATMRGHRAIVDGKEVELLTIGRAKDCEIWLDDETVSKHHATLELVDGRFVLGDLKSANGTFVDGIKLREGDRMPLEMRGSLTTLRFGPKVRLTVMDEAAFRAFLRSLLTKPSRQKFETTRTTNKTTRMRDSTPPTRGATTKRRKDELEAPNEMQPVTVILDAARKGLDGAQGFVVTLENALVEEFETWGELQAFVEGTPGLIVKVEVKRAEGGGAIVFSRDTGKNHAW